MIKIAKEKDGSRFEPYNIIIRIETMDDYTQLENELQLLENAVILYQEGRADYKMEESVIGRIYSLLRGD